MKKDGLSVWNWEEGVRVNSFSNKNPAGTRISAMSLVNDQDIVPLILTGSDDGVVRIWRGFYQTETLELVTTWRALTDLLPTPTTRGAGLVMDWQQDNGLLLTSGDVGIIRVWDIERELGIQDIPTGSDSCVTTLTHSKTGGHLSAAGYGDGSLRFFDYRAPGRYSCVASYFEHKSWVLNVSMPKCSNLVVSGVTTGDVKFWDLRKTNSQNTIKAGGGVGLAAMAVHDFGTIIASGLPNQKIRVLNYNGDEISMIRYHDGFLGQRIGPVSCLAFHPYKIILGAGYTDSIISIYNNL